ncbi:hypothetical protein QJS10_CPA10g00824 [Acorus calamus]|uniref:Bifunctional inhibitor/plant lipid transfer protein/seed storage helical domain-containing protein n=1 Tax=Acorus calamus TaxID=4465 RepID=A0AAV9E2C7_ACOCL|nr:hypothetical protein QJS10_CPA10g00824 [Acorus calamus]
MMMMMLLLSAADGVAGQGSSSTGMPDCASKLVACAAYLNATTKPPDSCCGPLTEAVTWELQCLCNLYENPSIFRAFNIDINQALRLPKLCGLSGDASLCNTVAAGPSSSNLSPPAATGAGGGAAGLGGSVVMGLLLLWSAFMV